MRLFLLTFFLLVVNMGLYTPECGAAAPAPAAFLLLDPATMQAYKAAYKAGGKAETAEVQKVLRDADRALKRSPYTIATKPQTPPSGDKHDFISQAPYWWPDPTKPDGLPYIQKDGLHNPEAKNMKDDEVLGDCCTDVSALALAYYFSGDERYARQAAAFLQAFFLSPATRMNPNLNFGQGIPGINTGRGFGIIGTRHLVRIPEAVALLNGSPTADAALVQGLKSWFRDYTTWLMTSPIALPEGQTKNNHGTYYDAQVVDFALFTGDNKLAKQTLQQQSWPRIATQLQPDGAQSLELARTRPWNYAVMNLQGLMRLALLAPHVGLDLWHYTTPDGRSLRGAVEWFRPYLLGQKKMEKADVAATSETLILQQYALAHRVYPDLPVTDVLATRPGFNPVPWAY